MSMRNNCSENHKRDKNGDGKGVEPVDFLEDSRSVKNNPKKDNDRNTYR